MTIQIFSSEQDVVMINKDFVDKHMTVKPETGEVFWKRRSGAIPGSSAVHELGVKSRGGMTYKTLSVGRKKWLLHRFIFSYVNGGIPNGMVIDHIDGDTSNNVISNLRMCSTAESSFNKGMFKNNTSGFKGVYWDKINKKWMAYITLNGKMRNLGRFSNINEAAERASREREICFGDFYRRI